MIYAFDEIKSVRRLNLIKLLLKHIVVRQREEEKFMKDVMENEHLYKFNIVDKLENVFYEIADFLGLNDEEEIDRICEEARNSSKTIDKVIEEFCEKYHL